MAWNYLNCIRFFLHFTHGRHDGQLYTAVLFLPWPLDRKERHFMCILHVGTGESTCRLGVFFLLLLTFIIFAAVLIFLLLQCSHFFATAFAFFWLLFCYLSCCCFLFAFTLGFLATSLVYSAAPFVRWISLLFWDQQDREAIHEKSVWCFCLSFWFFFFFVAFHVLTW